MSPEDIAFTQAWWATLLSDEPRMIRWLQKLQVTEFSGYADNLEARDKWAPLGVGSRDAARHIFEATAIDERRHSDLLVDLLGARNVALLVPDEAPTSIYWTEMEKGIVSLETCAAVFHLGEKLAAERFAIIHDMRGTPSDVRYFLDRALPDEQHHARIYNKLTTDEALVSIQALHDETVLKVQGIAR